LYPQGDYESNLSLGDVDAVTWGVFPGKDIAQPTIIEEESFKAWRDEAFEIWGEWEMLFAKETKTRGLLRSVGEGKWLVTVVVSCFACRLGPGTVRSGIEPDHRPLSLSPIWRPVLVSQHHDFKDPTALWRFLGCEEHLPTDEDVSRLEQEWA
jgi:hypothetical protein